MSEEKVKSLSDLGITKEDIIDYIKSQFDKETILEIVKEIINSTALKDNIQEVIDTIEQWGIVQGYLKLSKSHQKYILAGVALVIGVAIGYFI